MRRRRVHIGEGRLARRSVHVEILLLGVGNDGVKDDGGVRLRRLGGHVKGKRCVVVERTLKGVMEG